MKFSNFKLEARTGARYSDYVFFASVDVTTGFLFWKKTERKNISRKIGDYWFFVENGKFTPGFQVEELARSWTAKTGEIT